MPRLHPVEPSQANQPQQQILSAVRSKMGMVPNLIATMAQSPAVANAYLSFSQSLSKGSLPAAVRERIALAVGQANECQYCLSAHAALGKQAGLSEDDVAAARSGSASDPKVDAAVRFARLLVDQRGQVADADVDHLRDAGYGDGEVAEIVANVALNLFTNYFNHVAETEVDFPEVPALA